MDYICKCNKCGNFLYDENPKTDAVKIDATTLNSEILPMELFNEDEGGDCDSFWGCPTCKTDAGLTDVLLLPKEVKALKKLHEKIRSILIDYGNEEYGDCIIDEICVVVGIHPTTVYYVDE